MRGTLNVKRVERIEMAGGAKCYGTLSSVHDTVTAHMNSQELHKINYSAF